MHALHESLGLANPHGQYTLHGPQFDSIAANSAPSSPTRALNPRPLLVIETMVHAHEALRSAGEGCELAAP